MFIKVLLSVLDLKEKEKEGRKEEGRKEKKVVHHLILMFIIYNFIPSFESRTTHHNSQHFMESKALLKVLSVL